MSDGSLSQEEIDALLQDAGGMEFDEPAPIAPSDLTDRQLSTFSSIVSDASESMGSSLALLLSKSVSLGQPQIDLVNGEIIASSLGAEVLTVVLNFNSGDEHGFIMDPELAIKIAVAIQGMEGVELDEASVNALQEAMQSMFNPLLTALSDSSGKQLITNLPSGGRQPRDGVNLSGKFVRLNYSVTVDGEALGTIIEYFSAGAVASIIPNDSPMPEMGMAVEEPVPMAGMAPGANSMGNSQGNSMGNFASAGMQAPQQMGTVMAGVPAATIQGVQYPSLSGEAFAGEQGNIGLLMDVNMEMTVELGRTKKLIKDILGMGEGTIIELDKLAGEPVDILVNHKLIAKGEVVVIDENFGVRVTEIVSPMERMNTIS